MGDGLGVQGGGHHRDHAVRVTGSFDSAFKAVHKSTYRPPLEGMREVTMTMNARWTGPCKPGQKPGDVEIPGMPDVPKKR